MVSESKLKTNQRYLQKLEDIKIRVKKGTRSRYKTAAELNEKSLNAYIIELVEADIEKNPKTSYLKKEENSEL